MQDQALKRTIELGASELSILLSPFDLKRLESYANNMLDYHVVLDLLPNVAALYFEKRLGDDIRLSAVQSSNLLSLGLQRKTIEEVEVSAPIRKSHQAMFLNISQVELQLPVSQALALFVKIIRKISKKLLDIQKAAISAQLPQPSLVGTAGSVGGENVDSATDWRPLETSINVELAEAGDEATREMKEKQREMINSLDLRK